MILALDSDANTGSNNHLTIRNSHPRMNKVTLRKLKITNRGTSGPRTTTPATERFVIINFHKTDVIHQNHGPKRL